MGLGVTTAAFLSGHRVTVKNRQVRTIYKTSTIRPQIIGDRMPMEK
jgi:hypothetical protein